MPDKEYGGQPLIDNDPMIKRAVELGFYSPDGQRYKLSNKFMRLWLDAEHRFFQALEPILHYRDFFQEYYPQDVDIVMELSDSEAVGNIDDLVDAYNSNINIMNQGTLSKAKHAFINEARNLLQELEVKK